jgi:lipoprotein-releasing system permease protein
MLYLALRQLLARKHQNLLILLGISFGTMLYVSISAIQLGMRQYISEQLLNNTAHVLITGNDNTILQDKVEENVFWNAGTQFLIRWIKAPKGKRDDSKLNTVPAWREKLQQDPRVLDFVPRYTINAYATLGKFSAALNLVGTSPLKHIRSTHIADYMREGKFESLIGGANKIILGSGVAKKLGAEINDSISISIQRDKVRSFKIVGIIHFGNQQTDDVIAYSNVADVQILSGKPGRITEIAVALYDIDLSKEVAQEWSAFSKDLVQNWQETNKVFMEMIKMQDAVRFFITFSVLLVASFGIYNILSIMINQKKREIAILRAIGHRPSQILTLFLYQGMILGVSGGILGLLVGFGVSSAVESIDLGFQIGKSNHLLVSYAPHIYITGFFSSLASSLIASIIPARRAGRMTPMDIIRDQT